MTKSLNQVVVSYQDLCSKGLISDLKQAALCEVKTLCRLSCNNCPNVCVDINLKKVSFVGLQPDSLIIKYTENEDLDIHMSGEHIIVWLDKHDLDYKLS
ncbi:hypothetical protein Ping_1618 [Psychromonas ingrahamii 37]|uniref:Uncharacterized protein n=1 Tax=Psychromonas ingrahamii (strain DSM 17664 / CCUG 51855 / 37) TaxID=357804 RepID=A1SVA0_PSYIN|nr:hypothetical protein [Psychromonas ingrahamii]ABM03415.1 hypothetical protein Ping_1618 [Psychromonas ingrahamii 37]